MSNTPKKHYFEARINESIRVASVRRTSNGAIIFWNDSTRKPIMAIDRAQFAALVKAMEEIKKEE